MQSEVSLRDAETVLRLVAEWMGGADAAAVPTGSEAARRGLGPELVMNWDWPSSGATPTILLEGGSEGWAVRVGNDTAFRSRIEELGLFTEPYASYALCIYPA